MPTGKRIASKQKDEAGLILKKYTPLGIHKKIEKNQ